MGIVVRVCSYSCYILLYSHITLAATIMVMAMVIVIVAVTAIVVVPLKVWGTETRRHMHMRMYTNLPILTYPCTRTQPHRHTHSFG